MRLIVYVFKREVNWLCRLLTICYFRIDWPEFVMKDWYFWVIKAVCTVIGLLSSGTFLRLRAQSLCGWDRIFTSLRKIWSCFLHSCMTILVSLDFDNHNNSRIEGCKNFEYISDYWLNQLTIRFMGNHLKLNPKMSALRHLYYFFKNYSPQRKKYYH